MNCGPSTVTNEFAERQGQFVFQVGGYGAIMGLTEVIQEHDNSEFEFLADSGRRRLGGLARGPGVRNT